MSAKDLLIELTNILKVHPEAADAHVWADKVRISSMGYDRRHKPARLKLYHD